MVKQVTAGRQMNYDVGAILSHTRTRRFRGKVNVTLPITVWNIFARFHALLDNECVTNGFAVTINLVIRIFVINSVRFSLTEPNSTEFNAVRGFFLQKHFAHL